LERIRKKLGPKFSIDDIKREYELCEKDEEKTLIKLQRQRGDLSQSESHNS